MPEGGHHLTGRTPGKCLSGLAGAVAATGLKDGATISFHHHLRNGDAVINTVVNMLAEAGLRDLHLAVTSLFPVHAPLVEHIRSGVIGRISASFISGPVGEAISHGALVAPVTLRSHGGRARAIDMGEMPIDVAFVAAPAADEMGNLSGRAGRAPCGTLGYPMVDVDSAAHVVAVTDTLVPFPVLPIDIPQNKVDFVAVIPSIGDPRGIASGATNPATDALSLGIAENTAAVIAASGLLEDGFAFQTGAGGISLATAAAVGREMRARDVIGSFACGGITGFHVEMLEAGLFRALMDVQCFDLAAVASYSRNANHMAMSASAYAGPHVGGAVVDRLSAVVLGAAEVDLGFNVNVTTRAGGILIGGSGGHADAAQGARLTLITTRLTAAGYPKIVPHVTTRTTPGNSVDVVVTEAGLAVNPARKDLSDRLAKAGLPIVTMEDLAAKAQAAATKAVPPRAQGRIVALSEYRDGTIIDEIRQIDEA
ncbi:citrate lyase subunit alpha [Aestuariicoccus sp. MJ-SS9]|uniref:citrate lyase subunit alpha n=1 Tax=Aestuariicoccus sp. MJ-SS9 TaxID=3079855 RepID=UPI002911678A|nr:citrate lyase subunit alpha [Aestuariicoccus sp. MJ-SS9]MDU8913312.1 citrate lyase subunit alpha [Aestuariicoccus sp. MJ-SS9]